jgi:hypothetical protein
MSYPLNGQLGSGYYPTDMNPLQFFSAPSAPYSSLSSWGAPAPVPAGPVPTPAPAVAMPTYGVGSEYGPDNIDVGGGFNPALGGASDPGMLSRLGSWLKDSGILGSYDPKTGIKTDGWGGLALGAAQGLGGLYMGMQQYNLAKETLANNKAQFERNFAAQKATTNASLEDRQRARVASNPTAYQSVSDYMAQNGVR